MVKNDKTSPINLAVTSGKEISSFTGNQHVQIENKITLDRHNARLKLNCWLLSDPPHFSLPSTFNILSFNGQLPVRRPVIRIDSKRRGIALSAGWTAASPPTPVRTNRTSSLLFR